MDKNAFRKLTYGLYIVSSKYEDIKAGCVVNTVTQITSENPIVAISINKDNYTNKIIKESKRVVISILSQNINKDIISTFGFYSSKDTDKFKDIKYDIEDDLPIIKEGVCAYLIGDVINIIDAETHDIFLVRVSSTKVLNDEEVLTYKYYRENMKGRSPKKAPTYIEGNVSGGSKYRCTICGHIYDDDIEEIKFADLPDDWVCPVCGVTKDKFEKIN